MDIQLHSTDMIRTVDGIEGRLWEGTTSNGTPILAFISRIAVRLDQDQEEFERELQHSSAWVNPAGAASLRLLI